eukprot:scaffold1954_cov268-Pinguiococcus_pyrenoidosus.AAC.300
MSQRTNISSGNHARRFKKGCLGSLAQMHERRQGVAAGIFKFVKGIGLLIFLNTPSASLSRSCHIARNRL